MMVALIGVGRATVGTWIRDDDGNIIEDDGDFHVAFMAANIVCLLTFARYRFLVTTVAALGLLTYDIESLDISDAWSGFTYGCRLHGSTTAVCSYSVDKLTPGQTSRKWDQCPSRVTKSNFRHG